MEEYKIKTITLTLTNSCNLNCTYCYEGHKCSKQMTYETACEVLDKELAKYEGYDQFEIDFFGGEPFLEFELIKKICEYVDSKTVAIPYLYMTSTNGTLVHGQIQTWLKEHRSNFICGLSLDGNKKMHDINRCNSFDSIDLKFFSETYPKQGIKMTVSKETLPMLAEGIIFAHEQGFHVSCNLAYGIDWSDNSNRAVLEKQLFELIQYYLEHPETEPCSMLDMGISSGSLFAEEMHRYCGAGIDISAYDVDGRKYPCQFFMPLSIGEDRVKAVEDLQFFEDVIPKDYIPEKCRSCVINGVCPTCMGSNYLITGDMYNRDPNLCELTKIMIKAASYLWALKWQKKHIQLEEYQEKVLLKNIALVQHNIK